MIWESFSVYKMDFQSYFSHSYAEGRKREIEEQEGSIIYSISKSHLMVLAKDAGALYKVGNSALINTEIFEKYLEQFKGQPVPLPKHVYGNLGSN